MKIYNYAIIWLLLISCQKQKENPLTTEYKLNINTIKIGTDTLAKYQYDVFTFKNNDNVELITYNNTNHSLEFFNLRNKKLDK